MEWSQPNIIGGKTKKGVVGLLCLPPMPAKSILPHLRNANSLTASANMIKCIKSTAKKAKGINLTNLPSPPVTVDLADSARPKKEL